MKNVSIKLFAILLANAMILSGCATSGSSTSSNDSSIDSNSVNLSAEDGTTIGDSITASITLNGDSAQCDDSSVTIDGSVVTITSGGVYTISGTLNDGQIVVDASKDDKVELLLNGVDITCTNNAPIYIYHLLTRL
jgi:hypothetical protein